MKFGRLFNGLSTADVDRSARLMNEKISEIRFQNFSLAITAFTGTNSCNDIIGNFLDFTWNIHILKWWHIMKTSCTSLWRERNRIDMFFVWNREIYELRRENGISSRRTTKKMKRKSQKKCYLRPERDFCEKTRYFFHSYIKISPCSCFFLSAKRIYNVWLLKKCSKGIAKIKIISVSAV